MIDLNTFIYTNGVHDVMAEYVNRLLASSLRSEYKNVETLSATRELLDADTPLQLFDCNGANRICKLPPADDEENHLYLIFNSTASGTWKLTIQNNGETINHAVLNPGEFVLMLPAGDGTYILLGRPFSEIVSPSQITSNQNNYNPTGAGGADVLRLSSDASRNITGLGFPAGGKAVLIHNIGLNPIVLVDESASSTDINRFALNSDFTLRADQSVMLWYDPTSTRWRLLGGGSSAGREVLTANRTYYVRTDGNDSNTGLVNNSGGAFLTIQKAVNTVAALDISIYDVTIQLGSGTRTENVTLENSVGSGTITIQGDVATPSNVVSRSFSKATSGTVYVIKDMRLTGSGTNAAIDSRNSAVIQFGNLQFNTGYTYHLQALFGGQITAIANYEILSGASGAHVTVRAFGGVNLNNLTITLTGTPAFGTTSTFAFIEIRYCGVLFIAGNTFSGSATGRRYYVDLNGVAQSGGATLPGNAAGATATGGQYA